MKYREKTKPPADFSAAIEIRKSCWFLRHHGLDGVAPIAHHAFESGGAGAHPHGRAGIDITLDAVSSTLIIFFYDFRQYQFSKSDSKIHRGTLSTVPRLPNSTSSFWRKRLAQCFSFALKFDIRRVGINRCAAGGWVAGSLDSHLRIHAPTYFVLHPSAKIYRLTLLLCGAIKDSATHQWFPPLRALADVLSWFGDIRPTAKGTRDADGGHDFKVTQRKRMLWLKPRPS